jgi:hypothetical protein
MGKLIAIDPGVKMCGFAVFADDELVDAGIVRPSKRNRKSLFDSAYSMANLLRDKAVLSFADLVVERMRIYNKLAQEGDPNDLLDVAYVTGIIVGRLACYFRTLRTPTAHEWKGNIPKPIHHERIKRDCPQAEPLAQKTAKTYRHNVYDAIGLGLWAIEKG